MCGKFRKGAGDEGECMYYFDHHGDHIDRKGQTFGDEESELRPAVKERIAVGIDPGATGAIVGVTCAAVSPLRGGIEGFIRKHAFTRSMVGLKLPPKSKNAAMIAGGLFYPAVVEALKKLRDEYDVAIVAIEVQQAMKGDGKVSASKIVGDYQAIFAICVALELPVVAVRAKEWQASIVFERRVTTKAAREWARRYKWSNATKPEAVAVADRFVQGIDLTPPGRGKKPRDGVADAACIALFAAKRANSR